MNKLIRLNTLLITILINLGLLLISASQISHNLYAEGFNIQVSDPKAIQIANEVLGALGGKQNWENTHYICWNFLGRRFHIWDKWSGDLHFEKNNMIVLMNLHSLKGEVWQDDQKITNLDSLKKKINYAYACWINDSYWMFMPYKLKDSGVILEYKGEGVTIEGKTTDIIQLTFDDVGLTPQNKYYVYVDKKSHLVVQWDYFRNASDEKPRIQSPWNNWKQYGDILLSDDRGEKRKMADVAVFDTLPDWVFKSPKHVNLDELIKK